MRTLEQIDRDASPRQAHGRAGLTLDVTAGFDFKSADYLGLFEQSSASAFQHPCWLDAFFRLWAPARDATPVIVTGRDADGALVLVLPLIQRRLSGVTLIESADLGVSDYAAPVIDRAWWSNRQNSNDIADQLAHALPAHDVLRVKPVRPEHVDLWTTMLGGEVQTLNFSAHAVPMSASISTWRETNLSKSFAGRLARKRKRFFQRPSAAINVVRDPAGISAAFNRLASWRHGRFDEDVIQNPAALQFYNAVATAGAPTGFARTYALSCEGHAIGHAFAIAAGGRLNYLLIGCDYEHYGPLSPGLMLYDGMIEEWIEQGGTVFDFTIGDEPFKRDFGTSPTPLHSITKARTWRGSAALAALKLRGLWHGKTDTTNASPSRDKGSDSHD